MPTDTVSFVHGWELLLETRTYDTIVDIRPAALYARGHIPGAIHVPYEQVQDWTTRSTPPDARILVVDSSGARAAEMAFWMRRHHRAADCLEGGISQWNGPLERSP